MIITCENIMLLFFQEKSIPFCNSATDLIPGHSISTQGHFDLLCWYATIYVLMVCDFNISQMCMCVFQIVFIFYRAIMLNLETLL